MSIFKTTLRIKTDTPEGRKALGYLRNRDKTSFFKLFLSSYTRMTPHCSSS